MEMEYEARLREMDEKHQHELQELENAYQQKIMGEVERYQVILLFLPQPDLALAYIGDSEHTHACSADLMTPFECTNLIVLAGPCPRKEYATGSMERTTAAPCLDARKVKLNVVVRLDGVQMWRAFGGYVFTFPVRCSRARW